MYAKTVAKVLVLVFGLVCTASLFSCANWQFAPREPYMFWYYPKCLTDADQALDKLRGVKGCEEHYMKEKAKLDEAYAEYASCLNPCPRIEPCPAPPPPPPPPPAPTCKLTVNGKEKITINFGDSVELKMTTGGEVTSTEWWDGKSPAADKPRIEENVKKAATFTAKVTGPGGTSTCSADVAVRLTLGIHFPYDRPKKAGDKKFPNDNPETWFDKPEALNPNDQLDPLNKKGEKCVNGLLPDNLKLLKEAVTFVENNPGTDILVTGHTDCFGTREYNELLSKRRAQAVAAYIEKSLGKKIPWQGRGFSEPSPGCDQFKEGKCDRDACECRAKNRRVVITVTPVHK